MRQGKPDLVCYSHLRWAFVWQRPQHLMMRAHRDRRVFYVEEPYYDADEPHLKVYDDPRWPTVVAPHLRAGLAADTGHTELRTLLDGFYAERSIDRFALWHYSSWAVPVTGHLGPLVTVYDCMDDISLFADPHAARNERELLARADLVFAGGLSLHESKRDQHPNVHLFPSSVDAAHFRQARQPLPDPDDQAVIRRPRLGYFGVIDERIDLDLVAGLAAARPDWQLVMVGPVAKIDPAELPRAPNVHYLGAKLYDDLPAYLSGWDVALMPFARNDATRFISPTKGPEYLAAGKPVISTPIADVVRTYGQNGLVRIAETPEATVAAAEQAMAEAPAIRLEQADSFLADISWDRTWHGMEALVELAIRRRAAPPLATPAV